jgi:hypothetical protein
MYEYVGEDVVAERLDLIYREGESGTGGSRWCMDREL